MKKSSLEAYDTDLIAITGIACRLPGASDYQQFWQNLLAGSKSIREIPKDRWLIEDIYDPNPQQPHKSISKWGGFIEGVDLFDANFFGLSPREAAYIDPQQRLMLELSWSCLEDAGYPPEQLSGSSVGVFIGVGNYDYDHLQNKNLENIEGHTSTGTLQCLIPNRISYYFNFSGPSIPIDTACSSSLVAIHQAINSIQGKECDVALAGGVSLLLTPNRYISFSQMGMLSSTGKCSTFDSRADGYVRGEGAGVVLLKSLKKAIEDRDHIYGVIKGSSVNHGGKSRTLTSPNTYAQAKVIRTAHTKANLAPDTISYIETHGTGTPLGDPIEFNGLKRAFRQLSKQWKKASLHQPYCGLGSVKPNIGHLEPAAGIASVIKVLLAMKARQLPKIANFEHLNPHINLKNSPFYLVTETKKWEQLKSKDGEDIPLRAGVSSFGIGGVNAHLVLEEAPISVEHAQSEDNISYKIERSLHLLTLSAKTEKALDDLVFSYQYYLENQTELEIANICFTANLGRTHFKYRLAICGSDTRTLADKLTRISTGKNVSDVFSKKTSYNPKNTSIAFLFSGQGSQYINMGKCLYETSLVFREAIDQCNQILNAELENSLISVLYPETSEPSNHSLLNQTAYTQPALFSIEYALFRLWESWGIKPDIVMGHSVGEYVAATIAGVFSLEDGLKLIAHRGRLMQELPEGGGMAAVMAPLEQITPLIAPYTNELEIAAINGPKNIVISGKLSAIDKACEILKAKEIKTTRLQVSHAFHSSLMEPMLTEFAVVADQVTYHRAKIPVISNVTGTEVDTHISTPKYWVDHIRSSVKFSCGIETLQKGGYEIFLEIGPKPILLSMGRQCWSPDSAVWLPSLRSGQEDWQQMLMSLSQLYVEGVTIDWLGFHQGHSHKRVPLPTYPFQRQRHWIKTSDNSSKHINSAHTGNTTTEIIDLISQGKTDILAQKIKNIANLSSEELEVLPGILNILVQEHQKQLVQAAVKDYFYQIKWKLLATEQTVSRIQPSHWLILSDIQGVGEKLGRQLQARGCHYSLVYRGKSYKKVNSYSYLVNPSEPKEFEKLIEDLQSSIELPWKQVIHLWSLDTPSAEELTLSTLESSQLWGCGALLCLVQSIVKTNTYPAIWLITRGAQSVSSQTKESAIAASPLWGLGRVLSLEHPQLFGGLVDLDPRVPEDEIEKLLAIVSNQLEEDHFALRDKDTLTARLVKTILKSSEPTSMKVDATYLITGGLGALGLHTAKWMVSLGAKHIVLISRQLPSKAKQNIIHQLEQQGAQILVIQGNVSHQADLKRVLKEIQQTLPPLKGVIHAAGVVELEAIRNLTVDHMNTVLRAKLRGGWILHQLTQAIELDFFVCFSSIAAVWGSINQAHYAAANHFLDSLAHYRTSIQLPGLSINWGPWTGGGMADSEQIRELEKRGIQPLSPSQGIAALESLLANSQSQVTVAKVDWSLFKQLYESSKTRPLFEEIETDTKRKTRNKFEKAISTTNERFLFQKFQQASKTKRESLLLDYVQGEIARVLGFEKIQIELDQPITTMGIDSLMAVELRNQIQTDIGIELPLGKFLEEETTVTLVSEILGKLEEEPSIISTVKIASQDQLDPENFQLSQGQKSLWFLWKLAPESAAYNLAFTCQICCSIDIQIFQKAWELLSQRHPILRTTFFLQEQEPWQRVHPVLDIDFEQVDVCNWTEQKLKDEVVQHHQTPFNLECGPLMRVKLFTRSSTEHILLFSIHHICCDRSIGSLVEEWLDNYKILIKGSKPSCIPCQTTYFDYVIWQKELLNSGRGESLWQFWKKQLSGDLPVLNLPIDKPRHQIQTYNGGSCYFKLSEQLVEQIKRLAKLKGVTTFMLLLAAFQVLLYRHTGQDDILVGTPTSGRTKSEFAKVIGYFVNPMVMRANLKDNPEFSEFLIQVQRTVREAITHQEFPFALLVERLQPKREASHSPIFQASFELQNFRQFGDLQKLFLAQDLIEIDLEEFKLKSWPIPQQEALFDLDLEMIEGKSSLFGTFKYNSDLFEEQTIARLAENLKMLLEEIVSNPEQKVAQLDILTKVERDQLLRDWNNTQVNHSNSQCIHQLFEAQAEKTPDAVALSFEGEQLTYQQLNKRANQLAHYLQTKGVQSEVLVGICVEPSFEMVIGLLGILKAGGAYVPIDPTYPTERVAYMLSDTSVGMLLTTESVLFSLPTSEADIFCLDRDWSLISDYDQSNCCSDVEEYHLAYVIYTSGSTGKPKGVLVTHKGLPNLISELISRFEVLPSSRVLQFTSFSFDVSVSEVFMALCSGAALTLASSNSLLPGPNLEHTIDSNKITHINLTPSSLAMMSPEKLPNLKQVILGGEAYSIELVRQWSNSGDRLLFNAYGPTEATVCSTIAKINHTSQKLTVGRPIANTLIYILDRYLQPVPIGVEGEIYIAGVGLAQGYLNQDKLTTELFIHNPFGEGRLYKTGDRGRYLADGNIEFIGRIDNQAKIRGFRIELGEIESVLAAYTGVQQTVVVVKEDKQSNKILVAYVVSQDKSLNSTGLRRDLLTKLPDYMIPSAFVFLEALPLTPNGKIDRKNLALSETAISSTVNFVPPRDAIETQLVQIWSTLLDFDNIGINHNFFEIGGHSLLAVRLNSAIQDQFQRNLPLVTLFQNPTIEQLAQVVRSTTVFLPGSTLVAIQSQGSKPPLFCVHPVGGDVLCYQHLVDNLHGERPVFGLQSLGLDGQESPLSSIEEMASYYIKQIQKINPEGPYHLTGWSLGGVIAFEIAQQLQHMGKDIAFLALIDSYAPSDITPLEDIEPAEMIKFLSQDLGIIDSQELAISVEDLRQVEPQKRLNYMFSIIKNKNLLKETLQWKQMQILWRVFQANLNALYSYKPKTYSGPLFLFKAKEQPNKAKYDPSHGWNSLVLGEIKSRTIPGNHHSLMQEPQITVLAQQFQSFLEDVNLTF